MLNKPKRTYVDSDKIIDYDINGTNYIYYISR